MLDVGCGNNSPSITKKWFRYVEYHGIDLDDKYLSHEDKAAMKNFYKIDLEESNLDEIPETYFDVIIASHVIEHIDNGLDILSKLTKKLLPEGKLYIEYPSARSLNLPSVRGTLNFCDDQTHKRLYNIYEISNILLKNNLKIVRAGTRRDKIAILLFPIIMLRRIFLGQDLGGRGLWDITGFAEFIYAKKASRSSAI